MDLMDPERAEMAAWQIVTSNNPQINIIMWHFHTKKLLFKQLLYGKSGTLNEG